MKTLYLNINGEDVQSTDSMIVIGDERDAIIDSFYIALGEEITAGSHVRGINHKAIVTDFAKDKPDMFEAILSQWEEVKEILLSDDPTGEYTISLPPEFLHWLRYNSNPAYAEVYEKKFVGQNEAKVVLDIDSLYKDSLATIRRKVFRFWESDNDSKDIEEFVVNDECANGKSKLVRELREKLDIAFIRFDKSTIFDNYSFDTISHVSKTAYKEEIKSNTYVKICYAIPVSDNFQSQNEYEIAFYDSNGDKTDSNIYKVNTIYGMHFCFRNDELFFVRKTGLIHIAYCEGFVNLYSDKNNKYCFLEFNDSIEVYDLSKDNSILIGIINRDKDAGINSLELNNICESGYFEINWVNNDYDTNRYTYNINDLKRISIIGFKELRWIKRIAEIDYFVASNNNWDTVWVINNLGEKIQRTTYEPFNDKQIILFENGRWIVKMRQEEDEEHDCSIDSISNDNDVKISKIEDGFFYIEDRGLDNHYVCFIWINNGMIYEKRQWKEERIKYKAIRYPYYLIKRYSKKRACVSCTICSMTSNETYEVGGDFSFIENKDLPFFIFKSGYTFKIYDKEMNFLNEAHCHDIFRYE